MTTFLFDALPVHSSNDACHDAHHDLRNPHPLLLLACFPSHLSRRCASPRILVVSDDPTLRFSRAALLRKAGYRVESIASDDAALAVLERERFDLVLLGRDRLRRPGKALDRRLRERHPHLLTLKIEGNTPVLSPYASRLTDARPERVLAALDRDAALQSRPSSRLPDPSALSPPFPYT